MFIHLGQNVIVPDKSIIGVFDLEISSQARLTRDYLAAAERAGRVINVSEELPKSFVVCSEQGSTRVYISQISSATLLRRSGRAGL